MGEEGEAANENNNACKRGRSAGKRGRSAGVSADAKHPFPCPHHMAEM